MIATQPLPTARDFLRVWTPPDSPTASPAGLIHGPESSIGGMTLREIFHTHRKPGLIADKRSKDTITDYDTAIGHWETFTRSDDTAGDFVVDAIDQQALDNFRGAVADAVESGEYSAATANKWFRYIRTVLGHLGPRTKKNRRALCYWIECPFLDPLEEDETDPVHLEPEQLDALYDHCKIATWPPAKRTGVPAPTWWRVSLVVLVNLAMRRDDWLYLPASAIDWREGTVTFRAKKTKKVHRLVMHDVVREHLRMIVRGAELLFSPSQSHMQLYRQWGDIQTAAQICGPDGRPFGFHALRQTASGRFHEAYPGTAELLLGHALPKGMKITAKHYLGPKKLLAPLWRAMREIEQPESFRLGIESTVERMTS